MHGGLSVLVVVPARGGSKGVPRKNLQPVGGVPLVARVGQLVRHLAWVDRAVVSTDDDEIASVAQAAGLDAPFRRPAELSGDRIGDLEVLVHALLACEEMDGVVYDVVVMLQPTCPLRRAEHVTATVEELVRGGFDSVWTVSATDLKYHPRKQLAFDALHGLSFYDPQGATVIARQQLSSVYHRNGASYAIARQCLLEQRSLLGARASAVLIDEPLVSIDTLDDFAAVEAALAGREKPT